MLDSHEQLPVVSATDRDLQTDLAPFAALRDAAMAMTCHVVFEAWDADRPATLSPVIIDSVIRQRIGFHGLLLSDDLDMKALSGDVQARAAGAESGRAWGRDRVWHYV